MIYLALLLAVAIGIVIFISERIYKFCAKIQSELFSLVAGISVTYIFLQLLPELYEAIPTFNKSLFIFVLLGFSMFHIVEKYIFQNVKKGHITRDLRWNHAFGIFLYDLSIGIVLVSFLKISTLNGILFFIPVFLHAAFSNLSIRNLHSIHKIHLPRISNRVTKLLLAGAVFYGAILALTFQFTPKTVYVLTGLVAGILFYIIIRESIPKEKEGDPLFFIIGVLIYSLIIFGIWSF